MGPIKILIADPQSVVRFGVRHVVESRHDIKIIGEAASNSELIEKLDLLTPDVIIIDPFNFRNKPSISQLLDLAPESKVLIISDNYSKSEIQPLLKDGIHSFLTKACSKEEILNAIYSVTKGERFFCNKVLNVILNQDVPTEDCDFTDLTPREIEVVRLVAEGLSSNLIAEKLSLSSHTINTHRKNIMRKLQVSNSSELVVQAANAGILN